MLCYMACARAAGRHRAPGDGQRGAAGGRGRQLGGCAGRWGLLAPGGPAHAGCLGPQNPFWGFSLHLETANAALLEGAADSWEAALGNGASWRLVALLTPDA